jgi:hypothetical protein
MSACSAYPEQKRRFTMSLTEGGFALPLIIGLIVALTILGSAAHWKFKPKPATQTNNQNIEAPYASQEECEAKTGKTCGFAMCDVVPEGKTFEETCGKGFKAGWRPKNQSPTPTTNDAANWKTYKSKENLYKISYPGNWTVNDNSDVSMGDHAIDISIIEWNDGSKEYVEQQWQSVPCAPSPDGNGCAPLQNKEIKKLSVGNNLVYWKIDGNGQMHALIPNSQKNKTVEIYSGSLKDKNLFNQILSTFKFLN